MRYSSTIANYHANIKKLISHYKDLIRKLEASLRQLEFSLRHDIHGKPIKLAPNLEAWQKIPKPEQLATAKAAYFVKNQLKLLHKGANAKLATTNERYIAKVAENITKRITKQKYNIVESRSGLLGPFYVDVAKHDTKNWELTHNKDAHIKAIKAKIKKQGYAHHKFEADLIVKDIYDEVYEEVMAEVKAGLLDRKDAWWEIHRRQEQRIQEALKKEGGALITSVNLKHKLD